MPAERTPGVVLGPDGKPCKSCMSYRDFAVSQRRLGKQGAPEDGSTTPQGVSGAFDSQTITGGALASSAATAGRDPSGLRKDCPADVERLGRHTWTFLHTTAAYYPTEPSAHQRSSMLGLLNALPTLYPCSHCAGDLAVEIDRRPPDVRSRSALEQWLCQIHNDVNLKLGKDAFDCAKVGERWREGWRDGRCET